MNLVLQFINPKTEFETVRTEFSSIISPTHLTIQLNMMSLTISKPMPYQYIHEHVDLPLRNLKLLIRSLNICYDWVSSSTHLATGSNLLIWSQKDTRELEGDLVETTNLAILSPFPTVILSCTFTIFLLPSKDLLYFLKLISSKLTTKYQYTQAIYHNYHPLWTIRIYTYALWSQKHSTNISKIH